MGFEVTGSIAPDNLIGGHELELLTTELLLASGQGALARGSVIGAISKGAVTGQITQGNTGNGTIGTLSASKDVKVGTYAVECVKAPIIAAGAVTGQAVEGIVGDGAIGTLSAGANAKVGTYVVKCIAEAVDGGRFSVVDPEGYMLNDALVGVAYSGAVNFTIAAGDTDFDVGDSFEVIVAAGTESSPAEFSVIDPDGIALDKAIVGVAYSGAVNFTITDGNTDFGVGDSFVVAVATGTGMGKLCNSASVDGSQEAKYVLSQAVDTTGGNVKAILYKTGIFNRDALVFGGDDTAADHESQLRALGIQLRDEITY
jgi:hypothetical protein